MQAQVSQYYPVSLAHYKNYTAYDCLLAQSLPLLHSLCCNIYTFSSTSDYRYTSLLRMLEASLAGLDYTFARRTL